jgi:nucleotide-binding universal stress UspA family protein
MRHSLPHRHHEPVRTILVATDGSRAATAALEAAITLAVETGDEIVAITVWSALQGDYGVAHPSAAGLDDLLAAEREHAEAALDDAVARAQAAGVRIRTRIATGEPAREICAHARQIDARLIAVGTRGYGTVASMLLGSVSNAIIRQASCPVMVIREPEQPSGTGALLAARAA